jgi:hypothetical protein
VREHSIVGIEGRDGKFVGCGFAVTPRHILTCAHVVNAALGRTGEAGKLWPSDDEIAVCFQFLGGPSLRAKVVYWKPPIYELQTLPDRYLGEEEDIAGLELLGALPPIEPFKFQPVQPRSAPGQLQVYLVGHAQLSRGAEAEAEIRSKIPFGWFELIPTATEVFLVEGGYSGTAVYDRQVDDVCYGMLVAAGKAWKQGDIAYMIPSQELEPAIATLQLLDALSFTQETPENLQEIYRAAYHRCSPPGWHPQRSFPQSLADIVWELQDMADSTIAATSVSRIVEFAARLSLHPTLPTAKLRQWGQSQMAEFGEFVDQLKRAEVDREQQRALADPCLIFVVSSWQTRYRTEAFFLPDAQRYNAKDPSTYEKLLCWDFENEQEITADLPDCTLAALPDRLSGYFKTSKKRNLLPACFRLEVLLPLSLMEQPIEHWQLTHNAFGATIPGSEFPVVVRCAERASRAYDDDCGQLWKTNWARLQQHLGVVSHPHLAAVSPGDQATQLKARYRSQSIVGFQLNDPPQKQFFIALLGAAAPVAVWLRRSPPQPTDECRSLLQCLEDFLQCPVGQLPDAALRVRAAAIAYSETPDPGNFMMGHHLSLLWENPNLLPPLAPKTRSESR